MRPNPPLQIPANDQPDVNLATGTVVLWETADEMWQAFPVISQLYPGMTPAHYDARLADMLRLDYKQVAYLTEDGQCLGVAGMWYIPRLWCDAEINIDNVVVDRHARSLGIGKKLLDRCITYAEERGVKTVTLDSFVANPASHKFYFREGFTIPGYHFIKTLDNRDVFHQQLEKY